MNESLQRWCTTSLAEVHSSSVPIFAQDANEADLWIRSEQIVESAALMRLAQLRKAPDSTLSRIHLATRREFLELTTKLAASCPLEETTQPEVLGSIHEFLVARRGRSLVHTPARYRKSHGIFYTPQHVVDYIIQTTVVERLRSLTPDTATSLTVLDPSVGCGAFLLTAYRYLAVWYRNWFIDHQPDRWPNDLDKLSTGWQLSQARRLAIVRNHLFGVDLDPGAIEVAKRVVWLEMISPIGNELSDVDVDSCWKTLESNFQHGHALTGPPFGASDFADDTAEQQRPFAWSQHFPSVAAQNGFELIVGNPPYRREKDFKAELAAIARTPLGRFRAPRMDLWYYFVHRGIELLRESGTLSYITNAYWMRGAGADKLRQALTRDVHLDELILLKDQPLFQGVAGQHTIFRLTKAASNQATTIKVARAQRQTSPSSIPIRQIPALNLNSDQYHLFAELPAEFCPCDNSFLSKLNRWPKLKELGIVRQGIAENPATINRRTLLRFPDDAAANQWQLNEGVFSLRPVEIHRLDLSEQEMTILRPYHELSDFGRYWIQPHPSRSLVYSTRATCPSLAPFPRLRKHLERFRAILYSRRETISGANEWWHLHWPRDEKIWQARKIVAMQLATRPSMICQFEPMYVSFSANVFVPHPSTGENLLYLCALLNSRILWAWFQYHAKHRGVGIEINCHVLERAPIRRIDFADPQEVKLYLQLTELAQRRIALNCNSPDITPDGAGNPEVQQVEAQIEQVVANLYSLTDAEMDVVTRLTQRSSPAVSIARPRIVGAT